MDLKASVSIVIAAVVLAVGLSMSGGSNNVGGVPGVALYPQSVTTFTQGGGVTATSTAGAASTLLGTDIDTENYVAITPTGAAHTLTLPASTSIPGIPNAGDMRTIVVENAATAATTTTIAAGTGVDLQEPDGQNVVIGQNNYAVLRLIRLSNTDVVVTVDEHIPAD